MQTVNTLLFCLIEIHGYLSSSMPLDTYMYAQKLIIWDLGSLQPVKSQTLLTNIIAHTL